MARSENPLKNQSHKLPDRETLEALGGYEELEIEQISKAAELFNGLRLDERKELGPEFLRKLWPDPFLYAEKTHIILDNRVGSDTFGQLVRLVPNYAQRKLIELIKQQQDAGLPVRIIILKARQLGFSTFLQSWMYERCDRIPQHRSMTISYDDESTKEMFQKQITVKRGLWCPQETARDSAGLIEFVNGSVFSTATAGKFSAGRSMTFHDLHLSEMPMWPNAQEVVTGVMQTVAKHPKTAVFMESTAKGAEGSFYDYWTAAEAGNNSFIPFFVPWFWDPNYTYHFPTERQAREWAKRHLKPEDKKYQKRYKLDFGQMAWRHFKTQDDLQGNQLLFRQEYPASAEEAFLSSGFPFFSADLVHALNQQTKKPVWVGDITSERVGGDGFARSEIVPAMHKQPFGSFRVWVKPEKDREYIVGVDTAEGRVRDRSMFAKAALHTRDDKPDYSAAIVIDRETGRHVASWQGDIPVIQWPYVVAAIGLYYHEALLIPEVNNMGNEVVNTLAARLEYPLIYQNTRQIIAEGSDRNPRIGWYTDDYNRGRLFARGAEALNGDPNCTPDHDLVREIRTIVMDENGRPRAKHPNKDDRVLAWLLALQARLEFHMGELGDTQQEEDPLAKLPKQDAAIWRDRQKRYDRIEEHERTTPRPGGSRYALPGWYLGAPRS